VANFPRICVAVYNPTASQAASTAYVKAIPQREGRRLLTLGLSLCTPEERTRVLAEESGHARTDTALSVLAMAGPVGLELGTFFKSVYGFAYDPALHRAVLDTLLHRMRKRVPSDVKLSRTDEVFSLDCERPFLIPDPRCALETTDVVLMALAKSGTVSANDLASALLIPLRSVQAALAQLAEDGACDAARDGRRIFYQISDTTFTASTTSRS
jgi:DNA-binding transcriptional ArsR family regulator